MMVPEGGLEMGRRIRRKKFEISLATLIAAIVVIITISILYARGPPKPMGKKPKPTDGWELTLKITNPSLADILPVVDSSLGAAAIVLGTIISPPSGGTETKVVYNSAGDKICIRSKSGSSWRNSGQCVEGTKTKKNTPLTILDWVGGPSVYFLTTDNLLSGIDHNPKNDSWRLSSIADLKIKVHDLSQLSSVTWLNGTSTWVYYQSPDEQIWEVGMDDFRDKSWRNGSIGAVGTAQAGSGIGVSRWLNNTDEVEELFFQARDGGINGRMYAESNWKPDFYAIGGTTNDFIPDGASITATTANTSTGSTVVLSYIAKNGFLSVQLRGTTNISNYGAFSPPNQIVQGSGRSKTGLAAIGSLGAARMYLVDGQNIKELSSTGDSTVSNWTTVNL
ncbi:MAG: hypothetical protein M1840_007787 [Geoglossum simile]|nr:MAG: hypothetical protein M1840_007787 [Geoglossum simile]